MSIALCTFSGKYGDILWSLATVKAISEMLGECVDMAVMPQYESLMPLLRSQPYISRAFVIPEWQCTGSPHGDQPGVPPQTELVRQYTRQFHLAYQGHPGITAQRMSLVDFIAFQQGMKFVKNPVPFIDTFEYKLKIPYVAYAFNAEYHELKQNFKQMAMSGTPEFEWKNCSGLPWKEAALCIKNAQAFVGCRSANWVLACGVGQKRIFTYEPNPARSKHGMFGDVFGCPYVNEQSADPYHDDWANRSTSEDPGKAAAKFVKLVQQWKEEEIEYANAQTQSR